MRNRLILLALGCISIFGLLEAQEYEPMVDTAKRWVTYQRGSNDPFEVGFTLAWKFTDSTKIDEEYWINVANSWDSLYQYWEVQGFIREVDKVITYMDKHDMIIDTLYDFNKGAGDTLDFCVGISEIDSIEFIGKKRRTQLIKGHHLIDEFHYEGVGSNAGLMGPYNFCKVGMYTYLVCYYEKGELLYLNPDFNSCYKNSFIDNIESNYEDKIEAYPNPSEGVVFFDVSQLKEPSTLVIYNQLGKEILQQSIQTTQNKIDIAIYNGGIYFYKISNQNQFYTGKIIVEK